MRGTNPISISLGSIVFHQFRGLCAYLHHKMDSVHVGGFKIGCRCNLHLFLDVSVEERSLHARLAYFQVQLSSDRKHHPDALKPENRSIGSTAVSTMNLVPALRHYPSFVSVVGLHPKHSLRTNHILPFRDIGYRDESVYLEVLETFDFLLRCFLPKFCFR